MTAGTAVVRRVSRGRDERGATIVLFALVLVVLLVFTAFAVDLGSARQKKRGVQTGADGGALGAVQEVSLGSVAVVNAAKSLVEQNLELAPGTITDADWSSCSNPGGSTPRFVAPFTCISFDNTLSELRVRVPPRVFETYFAGVVGIDELRVSGEATAAVRTHGFGGVLPFALVSGGGGGDGYECVKTDTGGNAEEPCSGPESGNFGFLNFRLYAAGDIPSCTGQGNDRVEANIAEGVDHSLSRLNGKPYNGTAKYDQCTPTIVDTPNGTDTTTGLLPATFHCGILAAPNGSASCTTPAVGRLARGANLSTFHGTQQIDDGPLWEFIPSGSLTGVPAACHRDQFDGALGALGSGDALPANVEAYLMPKPEKERMRLMLQRCFSIYNTGQWIVDDGVTFTETQSPGSGVLFGSDSATEEPFNLFDIQLSPRFAYVPELTVTTFPNGTANVSFQLFRGVFLQRLLGCNGTGTCAIDWEPGVSGNTSANNQFSDAVTAFVFNPSMLPGGLGSPDAPFDIGVNKFVELID